MAFHVYPPFWTFLEDKKRGNSDHLDRIDILEMFINSFGKEAIKLVLGDREFIGKHWINYLIDNGIPYVFRLKEDGQYISNSRGKMVKTSELFQGLNPGRMYHLGKRKVGKTEPISLHCTAYRNQKGELLVVMHSDNVKQPIESYARRWDIETMFKAFKSSGFRMEDTHITHPDRLDTLFGVIALAFSIACKTGKIIANTTPILIKKHGRRAQSIFRLGLDTLKNCIVNKINKSILNNQLRMLLKVRKRKIVGY